MNFDYPEDKAYFEQLLCDPGEDLSVYEDLFDFRPSAEKRRNFGKIRTLKLQEMEARYGKVCLLGYAPDCDVTSGPCVDHLIPLSSNKLNKELRGLGTLRGPDGKLKKTPTQSFGSNHSKNIVLACVNCNSRKMNALLPRQILKKVLARMAGLSVAGSNPIP